jgi:two-component system chemotaxis response regulator CheB
MKQFFLLPGKFIVVNEPTHITTVLGSCVAVALYDPVAKVAGLNHFLLPESPAGEVPSARYGEFALRAMMDEMLTKGANPRHLQAKVYGGGEVLGSLRIGKTVGPRNVEIAEAFLKENGIPVRQRDTGGKKSRKITFSTDSYDVRNSMEKSSQSGEVDLSGFGTLGKLSSVSVVIVDDSVTVRNLFSKIFKKNGLNVLGAAANAFEARQMIFEGKPDVITLDVEMPKMNGVKFLEKLMKYQPMPVVMVSSLDSEGEAAMRALELGAIEFVHKPSQFDPAILRKFGETLVEKVRAAASSKVRAFTGERSSAIKGGNDIPAQRVSVAYDKQVVVLGGNTGSQEPLLGFLKNVSSDSPPIVIANSTISGFVESFIGHHSRHSNVRLEVAKEGMALQSGTAYFLSDGKHGVLKPGAGGYSLGLVSSGPVCGQIPSANILFESAAEVAKAGATAVMLSGFGSDGVHGLGKVKGAGGFTLVESPSDARFPHAPQNAINTGVVDVVASSSDLARELDRYRSRQAA